MKNKKQQLVPFLFLFGEHQASQQTPDWARPVLTWNETTETILKTPDAGCAVGNAPIRDYNPSSKDAFAVRCPEGGSDE